MSSLNHRRDVRTVEEFSDAIKLGVLKEKIWSKIFKIQLETVKKGWSIKETGVDNTGKLIKYNLKNNNVDKLFTFWSEYKTILLPMEIKTIPENLTAFMTFKASSLMACEKHNACILVPKRYEYYILSKKMCIYLYNNYTHRIYWDFDKNKGFSPNDKAVRIFKRDIDKFIEKKLIKHKKWGKNSRKEIEKNWEILSKKANS